MDPSISDDLFQKQLELEAEAKSSGIKRFRDRVRKAREKGSESNTAYGRTAIKLAIENVANGIRNFLEAANSGKPGRKHLSVTYLNQIDPEVAAFIGLKVVLDEISREAHVTNTAVRIGTYIQNEVRLKNFKDSVPRLFKKVEDQVKSMKIGRQIDIMRHTATKHNVDPEWEDWPKGDRASIGFKILEIIENSTPYIRLTTVQRSKNKKERVLTATPLIDQLISKITERMEVLNPAYLPCVIPPKRWDAPIGGGYYENRIEPLKLVKSQSNAYQQILTTKTDQMKLVYSGVNAMQDSAWVINKRVLDVARTMWEEDWGQAGLPDRENRSLPEKPQDIDTNDTARIEWKREATKVYDFNAKIISKRLLTSKTLWLASRFANEEAIYFPYTLDFRSRAYCVPSALNPQGNDLARGLLTFAKGKPIDDKEALDWLKIHGANAWGSSSQQWHGPGLDKLGFGARLAWIGFAEDDIVKCAEHPFDETWWMNAEHPWQFLAFCFEFAEFKKKGFGFVSHLPIAMDGTCNGLQHFAAMMRDEIGGEAVNLVPLIIDDSDQDQEYEERSADIQFDVYSQVAERVQEKLQQAIEHKSDKAEMAENWLVYGVDRKLCKRPVMTMPYGGTQFGMMKGIQEDIESSFQNGKPHPWGENVAPAASYISKLIWESIGEIVRSARTARDWMENLARIAAKHDKDIQWVTPVGFPVLQAPRELDSAYVYTTLGDGIRKKITLAEESDRLDTRKHISSLSPNFVHSLDASALYLTIDKAVAAGVNSFAMIHDSYGVPAADAETMNRCLREAFVEMYQQHDVMQELHDSIAASLPDGVELPDPPAKGKLDMTEVLESEFFFN